MEQNINASTAQDVEELARQTEVVNITETVDCESEEIVL